MTEDNVNRPAHYNSHPSGIEAITICEHMGFCTGNAIKYIWRAGLKDPERTIEDLRKAIWYLEREITRIDPLADERALDPSPQEWIDGEEAEKHWTDRITDTPEDAAAAEELAEMTEGLVFETDDGEAVSVVFDPGEPESKEPYNPHWKAFIAAWDKYRLDKGANSKEKDRRRLIEAAKEAYALPTLYQYAQDHGFGSLEEDCVREYRSTSQTYRERAAAESMAIERETEQRLARLKEKLEAAEAE